MMTIRFRRACRRPLAIAVPLLLTLAVSAARNRASSSGRTTASSSSATRWPSASSTSTTSRRRCWRLSAARAVGPQPRVERRHADAAAAAAQLRRRREAPDRAAGRRDPGVLRRQRVVRRRGRHRRSSSRTSRPTSRSIARRGTTARRRRAWRWCRRSRTSGSRAWCTSTSTRATASWRATPKRCARWRRVSACRSPTSSRRCGRRWPPRREPLTINGIHLNEDGDRVFAGVLMTALGLEPSRCRNRGTASKSYDDLRELIREKNRSVLSLPSPQRRVRRRPARRSVRVGELPARDEAARRADRGAGEEDLAPGARTVAEAEAVAMTRGTRPRRCRVAGADRLGRRRAGRARAAQVAAAQGAQSRRRRSTSPRRIRRSRSRGSRWPRATR